MDRRPFGKPPGSGTGVTNKEGLKSELYTKIGTRSAVITAHYEHVQPLTRDRGDVKLKQVTFSGDVARSSEEPIYDVPKNNQTTKL